MAFLFLSVAISILTSVAWVYAHVYPPDPAPHAPQCVATDYQGEYPWLPKIEDLRKESAAAASKAKSAEELEKERNELAKRLREMTAQVRFEIAEGIMDAGRLRLLWPRKLLPSLQ